MVPTSTIVTDWAPSAMFRIWDSISGFFYTANGKDFTIVFIILIGVVCLVIAGIKYVFPWLSSNRKKGLL